jgi:putative spermidine/putrescine transport system substrate-binding protein
MALGLVGCGGDDDEATPTPMVRSGSPVAIVPEFNDPNRWAGRVLRVAAWGGEVQTALRTSIWNPFAAATGCRIQEVGADYAQLASSVAGGRPYADVLIVDEVWAETAAQSGAVETLSHDDLDRDRFGQIAATEIAIPAYAYAMVNAFRRDAVEQAGAPENWADWWDVSKYDGRRSLPRNAFGSFEFALLADGVGRDELYPIDEARAVESLKRISSQIVDLWWESGLEPIAWMSSDRLDLSAAWHYRVVAGQLDGRAIDFQWNQGLLVADCWVVAKGSPARDVAVDFLRYATTPAVQAALARSIPLGPVTPKAFEEIEPRIAKSLPTAPDAIDKLIRPDRAWWAANRAAANEQFACLLPDNSCAQPAASSTTTP